MRKILVLLSALGLSFTLVGCKNSDKEIVATLNNIQKEDTYIELDSKTKDEIETCFKNYNSYYNNNFKWSIPYEVQEFNTLDELQACFDSNTGFRVVAKYDDLYVLTEWGSFYNVYTGVTFNDEKIIGYKEDFFGPYFRDIIFYKDGKIISNNNFLYDLNDFTYHKFTEKEALDIKEIVYNYNEYYYSKFLTQEEKENNDYKKAYNRIYLSFLPEGEKEPAEIEMTTTTEV